MLQEVRQAAIDYWRSLHSHEALIPIGEINGYLGLGYRAGQAHPPAGWVSIEHALAVAENLYHIAFSGAGWVAFMKEYRARLAPKPEPEGKNHEPIDTPFGRVVFDSRVPVGEIRLNSWDGHTLVKNIAVDEIRKGEAHNG